LLNLKADAVGVAVREAEEGPRLQVAVKNTVKHKKEVDMAGITKLAMASLGKELIYDGRIQEEEVQREKTVETKNALTIERAKEKLENLKKQETQSQESGVAKAQEIEGDNQVATIKNMIKSTIMRIRTKQAEKIRQMQIIHNLATRDTKQNLDMIRIKTAVQAVKAAVVGDQAHCTLEQEKQDIEDYCYKHYKDNPDAISDCMDPAQFCFKCCDSEFGAFHINLRDKCYQEMCGPK